MSQEVEIIVRGPTGSGKSGLLGEIQILLQALRIPHRFADPEEWASEINLTGADWTSELERTKPVVVLREEQSRLTKTPSQLKAYEDGRVACREGKKVLDNPYLETLTTSTMFEAIQWLTGYNLELASMLSVNKRE